jgi:GntP family gluconate:H+ symporter
MNPDTFRMLWAGGVIVLLVLLVSLLGLHPFLALLTVAIVLGIGCGLPFGQTVSEFQTGFGDTMKYVGIIIGLGTMLGTLLVRSGGADALANALARAGKKETVGYRVFFASLIVGLPLFFEVGFVLLVPIAYALAREMKISIIRVGLPMLAGLSVAHGLVPPHPAPTLAVGSLHAEMGRTIMLAIILGIPIGFISGPFFANFAARWVPLPPPDTFTAHEAERASAEAASAGRRPSLAAVLFCVLLPVVLMMAKSLVDTNIPDKTATLRAIFDFAGDPIMALFWAVLAGLILLGMGSGSTFRGANQSAGSGLGDIAGILLIVGAGGGFKQMLIATKVAAALGAWALSAHLSPLILGWLAAVLVRLATGSATVATITAVGLMTPIAAANPGVNKELLVLAIGCGSVFLSHVNDAGFWLVKEYFRMSVPETFKTWSLMETLISVVGLGFVMLASLVL